MENTFFEYPAPEGEKDFDKIINEIKSSYRSMVRLSAAFVLSAIAAYVVYIITNEIILLIISFVLWGISLYVFKGVNKREFHVLKIKAYDEYMELDYFFMNKHKKLSVYYSDIIFTRFNNKDYTSFQIVFDNSGKSKIESYNSKGRKIDNISDCIFIFKINPQSWEQAFFLYYAEKYFDIRDFEFTKKLERKYGTAEEYAEKLK